MSSGDEPAATEDRPNRAPRRLFGWSLIGRGCSALFAWAVLIVLAKFGDTATAELRLGQYVFALAVTSPLIPVVRMELRALLAADAVRRVSLPVFVRLRTLGGLAMVAVCIVVAVIVSRDPQIWQTIAALALMRAVEGGLDLAHGVYERSDRHDLTARSEIVRSGLGLVLLTVVMATVGSLSLALCVVAGGWLAVLVVVDLPTVQRLTRTPHDETQVSGPDHELPVDEPTLLGEAWRAAPLGLAAFLITFNTTLPRYFIEGYAGTAELGVFGAVAYLMAALTLVNAAIISTLRPRFGRHLARGDNTAAAREMLGAIGLMIVPGVLLALVGLFWGDVILAALYRDSFDGQAGLMVWLAVAHVFGSAAGVPRALLTAGDRLRIQPAVLLGAVAICALTSALLIPHDPLLGAAQALLVSRAFLLVANLGVAAWHLRTAAAGGEA